MVTSTYLYRVYCTHILANCPCYWVFFNYMGDFEVVKFVVHFRWTCVLSQKFQRSKFHDFKANLVYFIHHLYFQKRKETLSIRIIKPLRASLIMMCRLSVWQIVALLQLYGQKIDNSTINFEPVIKMTLNELKWVVGG